MIGYLVFEGGYEGEEAIKVWLDREKAEAQAAALNLEAYRRKWLFEERSRRLAQRPELLRRSDLRMPVEEAMKTELPAAFEALGLTAAPGPFSVREIEIE